MEANDAGTVLGTWNWDGGNSTAVKSNNGKYYCAYLYNSVGKHTIICVGKNSSKYRICC